MVEGRGKKEEGVNFEKKGKKIEITISNELEQLFLSISDQYLPFPNILFSKWYYIVKSRGTSKKYLLSQKSTYCTS